MIKINVHKGHQTVIVFVITFFVSEYNSGPFALITMKKDSKSHYSLFKISENTFVIFLLLGVTVTFFYCAIISFILRFIILKGSIILIC